MDPRTAPQWYANIAEVEVLTRAPSRSGAGCAPRALPQPALAYTYEVVELGPERVFTMTTSQGPSPMTTTYAFEPSGGGGTVMRLRNHGTPSGFGSLAAPAMAAAMRRANRADLARIRELLEAAR